MITKHNIIIFFTICIHIILALIYCNNQILSSDGMEILSKGFTQHYYGLEDHSLNLYTSYVSVPMYIWENLYSPMILIMISKLLSFYIIYYSLKPFLSRITMTWFSVIYLLSPWFLYHINISYNTYLDLGVALFLYAVCNLYTNVCSTSKSLFFILILCIGIYWCSQFHSSWVVLLIITILLLIKKSLKLNRFCFYVLFLALILISSYTVYKSLEENPQIPNDDGFIGYGIFYVYPIFKTLIYWIRFSSTVFPNNLLLNTEFHWISASQNIQQASNIIWLTILYAFGIFSLLVSLCANFIVIKHTKSLIFSNQKLENNLDFLKLIALFTIIALIIYSAIYPHLLSSWQLNICFIFSLIPLLVLIEKYKDTKLIYHFYWIISLIAFLGIVNFCGAVESKNYNLNSSYVNQVENLIEPLFN